MSEWETPIIEVPKSDGSLRICGDYKITLNKEVKRDEHPMPRIEELATKLAGEKIFHLCILPLHIHNYTPKDEESQNLTTINTHCGLYKYSSKGLKNRRHSAQVGRTSLPKNKGQKLFESARKCAPALRKQHQDSVKEELRKSMHRLHDSNQKSAKKLVRRSLKQLKPAKPKVGRTKKRHQPEPDSDHYPTPVCDIAVDQWVAVAYQENSYPVPDDKSTAGKKFKKCVYILVGLNRVAASDADMIVDEFEDSVKTAVTDPSLVNFSKEKDRLDQMEKWFKKLFPDFAYPANRDARVSVKIC
ncbi:transposon Tf2-6 polyprotein [Elysia marginata]|uniref:Transposon Tf2-6 polyprotein n=1 Tax=Elysia marginata TaxID=1093978 RepID=A0AAV4I643_9GAST|nr:transposon Tf2-6 polyprotein [Elysia marginata]